MSDPSISLGLRAHPQHVTYAVVRGDVTPPVVTTLARLRLPFALHPPEQLAFTRTTLLDLIREFGVTSAGIRTAEPVAQRVQVFRLNVEGVIQELLGAGAVPRYFAGPLASIGGLLRIPLATVKQYASGVLALTDLASPSPATDTEDREAILTALAALQIGHSRLTALGAEGAAGHAC